MIDVFAQPCESALLLCGGVLCALLYLLLRLLRFSGRRWLTHLFDALFLLGATAIFAACVLLATHGVLRGFLLVSFCVGFLLAYWAWNPLFQRITQKICKNRFRFP